MDREVYKLIFCGRSDHRSRIFAVSIATFMFALLWPLALQGQSTPPSGIATMGRRRSSDPQAIATMRRLVESMGGAAAWQTVGAAKVDIIAPLPGNPQRVIHWTDDWSNTSVLAKRDLVNSADSHKTMVTSGDIQTHFQADGTHKEYPRDPDVALLAVGYPAVALLRSLHLPNCVFSSAPTLSGRWPRPPLTQTKDESVIYEQCIEPLYPDGRFDIAWIVSADASGLRGVWLPVRGMLDNTVMFEQVRFTEFQSVDNLLTPKTISITRPNGRVDTLHIDRPTFTSKLTTSDFTFKK